MQAAEQCDVLVAGSGAGGLACAVTAASLGLSVIVAEKEPVVGGTTAWSGGWLWIPHNPLAIEAGIVEPADAPRRYLEAELGRWFDADRVDAFLEAAPRMIDFFRRNTVVQFIDGNLIPDFHDRLPGAGRGGRSVCAAPYDARELGADLALLRPPLDLLTLWGMGIASGADLRHFLMAMRSGASFVHVARRVAVHLKDRLLHGRGMQLVNGNALAARLLKAARDHGVEVRVRTPVVELVRSGGRVVGARVGSGSGERLIRARRGVILACGGFPHDVERHLERFPHAAHGSKHWSAAPPCNSGDGLRLGERAGGVVERDIAAAGAWAPVSLVRRADGTTSVYPHLIERAKPGVIAVTSAGTRFCNEADSYYDFMDALFAALPPGAPVEAWLVCDHRFIRRYGLGAVRPAPLPLRPWLASGYLTRRPALTELAIACGIDAPGLVRTLADYNVAAAAGTDPQFGRGASAYNRIQGDALQRPNPCVAPIDRAPFYAVRIVPGSLGTFAGLRTDAVARVLDGHDAVVPGLFACGADMSSIMGGRYPSGGITLGPAMTFGFLAAHALASAEDAPDTEPLAAVH